ncbi:translation initiation factor 4E [Hokovirus HKV1]|uniref:Translation initiation factor 4E n=1 Tax=Hokovirus HKV1 TaxID=1977638 RepID=A0A1V0SGZ9_9VIRU|nr:translation initiation factor 4E [Hokovirus HKV1]
MSTDTLEDNIVDNGQQYTFIKKYVLWAHSNTKDPNAWGIDSFDKVVTISNVSEFWRLFNNFEKFDYINKHYFLMLEGVVPLWEHHTNSQGGTCSFKTKIQEAIDMLVFLAVMMTLDNIKDDVNDGNDINGVSISPHGPSIIVKIWNKTADDDFEKKLSKNIINKYGKLSITYKKNASKY